MANIPRPVKKKETGPDKSAEYLQKWKELFNAIDPENIKASIEGDEEFPKYYNVEMNRERLEGACDLDIQLYISIGNKDHLVYYGNEIYCCLQDTAFASGWIEEVDENLDTTIHIPWHEMYERLVKDTETYFNRIPPPPECK